MSITAPPKQSPLHFVAPPNPRTEKMVNYYEYATAFFERHYKHTPHRKTLIQWATAGYPVWRHGPRVAMPVKRDFADKRVKTSQEAMERFLTVVRHLEREIDQRLAQSQNGHYAGRVEVKQPKFAALPPPKKKRGGRIPTNLPKALRPKSSPPEPPARGRGVIKR